MKTIVNLVSEQTTPNYLFIKDMVNLGDELLFISSEKFKERINWIINALGYKNCVINQIVLPDGVEEKWYQMIALIKRELVQGKKYVVNLTCGTKYMISAVPKAFDGFDAEFYYIPFPKNVILKVGDENSKDISNRITVKEYFECNNTVIPKQKGLTKSEEYTKSLFQLFVNGKLRFDIIEKIRIGYREKQIVIKEIEDKEHTEKKPQINGLFNFLNAIAFPFEKEGLLTKDETVYLTGGWFEEYVFSLIMEKIQPQDIALGVGLPITDLRTVTNRDLDVVFTYENKLFVIECKTGIDREYIFSETVYKAAALKNERLGKLSANTFIFALSGENENFKEIAKALNISYYDKSFFVNPAKWDELVKQINKKAKG